MKSQREPGLGELLRHLSSLCDDSNQQYYRTLTFPYRPRFTPLMRLLQHGPMSVSALTEKLSMTQGAISQSLQLMLEAGLIERCSGSDGRQSIICLSTLGKRSLRQLRPHWTAILDAIHSLEIEIGSPLRTVLQRAIAAMETQSFIERIEAQKRMAKDKDTSDSHFQCGEQYQRFRPDYPQALVDELARLAPDNTLTVDVGCGTGQMSGLLAQQFRQVIAIDNSADQLVSAKELSNVEYRCSAAEETGVPDRSVDLIVAAQAAHWFDLPRFYSEVRRIAKPEAILALISYGVPFIRGGVNGVFQHGYWQSIHRFWPSERRHVENGYCDLNFPFEPAAFPDFEITKQMRFEEFKGYVSTWSAWRRAKQKDELNEFQLLFDRMEQVWASGEEKVVVWPIASRVARLNS